MFDISLNSWKMKLVVGFYLAWLSTRNSCKWSPCICWFNIFMTWSTSTDHLEIMSTNPSFLPQPMRCIVYKSYRFTRYQFFPFHFSILWPGSTFVWVWGRTGGRGGRPAWLRACARSGRDACERGELVVGGGGLVGTPRRDLHHSLPIWEEPSL